MDTLDNLSLYANPTDSVTNSFFKSTSTVDLIAASVCETTTPSILKQVSAEPSVTLTSNPRTDQATNTTYQFVRQTSPQAFPQVDIQCSEVQTSPQPGNRSNFHTSSGFGNPSKPPTSLQILNQFKQQSGLPRQLPSMEQDQLMTLPELQAQTQYKTTPIDQIHMQPNLMIDINDIEEFISTLPADEMTFSESKGQGQMYNDRQTQAEREVPDPNNTMVYQRLESPMYNQVISPVRRPENQEPQRNPQLTPQPDANIPMFEQFVDLGPIMNRLSSTQQTPNDSGLFKAIAQGDDSHLHSVQGVKGSTISMDFVKKIAKARRKGTRIRASRSESSIDQNSDAYKQYLATLSPRDRTREQNRHAAKRFRDKMFKRQESQEMRAETLYEENRRLMAVKTREEEKYKTLMNSVCVYHWTKQSRRGGH